MKNIHFRIQLSSAPATISYLKLYHFVGCELKERNSDRMNEIDTQLDVKLSQLRQMNTVKLL